MKRLNKTRLFLTLSIFILIIMGLFIFINKNSNGTGLVTLEEEPIKIGGAFALTGFGVDWGNAELNGARLAIEEINNNGGINGRKIDFIVEDIVSDNKATVSAVQKLINVDNVKFIIGPTWLATYGGASPLADQYKVVMITPSDSITAIKSEQNYDYVFSSWYSLDQESKKLVQHLLETDQNRVILFFGNDPFWQDFVSKFKNNAKGTDIEIIDEFKLNTNDLDFRTYLTNIKQSKPDAILFGLNDEKGLLAFLKQKKELYPESKGYSTEYLEGFIANDEYNLYFDSNIFYVSPAEVDKNFAEKYESRFGMPPLFSASNSYDATKMIVKSIEETDSLESEEIRDYLLNNEFDTVTFGKARFSDIGGIFGGEFIMKTVKNGNAVEI